MNKKQLIVTAILLMAVSLSAYTQQGGYTGPGAAVISVEEAKKLRDDSHVILRGKIERSLGDETYLFADASGKIIIEIDRKIWGALSVDENDLVEISGEIDKGFKKIEVEVETIQIYRD
jgi:uncharacterized protein (TIGR00156 family)